jgi:dTDP-glucose pyrophosphorylase
MWSCLGRGMAWLDTGSPEGMLKAAVYVKRYNPVRGSTFPA